MSIEVSVICDGCAMIGGASSRGAQVARAELREFGWRTALPGGRDLCSDCAERENEREPAQAATSGRGEP